MLHKWVVTYGLKTIEPHFDSWSLRVEMFRSQKKKKKVDNNIFATLVDVIKRRNNTQ